LNLIFIFIPSFFVLAAAWQKKYNLGDMGFARRTVLKKEAGMGKKLLYACAVCFFMISAMSVKCRAEEISLQLVKDKVDAAVKLFEKEGEASFPKFKDPNGEFRFGNGEGYIWIHSLSGIMVMHATKPSMEGMNQLDLKDSTGFLFIEAMNQLVQQKGEGWVVYLWAKPGISKKEELKSSFVKLANRNGRKYVVGCGLYGVSIAQIKVNFPNDVVCDSVMFEKGI
jgi:signal transduction histidine kinase